MSYLLKLLHQHYPREISVRVETVSCNCGSDFNLYLILFNSNLNLNNHMWLMATVLDNTTFSIM